MTCIVGIRTRDGVTLAGDSAGSSRHTQTIRSDVKTFRLACVGASVAVGICGSYRMSQVMRAHLDVPDFSDDQDEWEWSVRWLVPELRKTLAEHGAQHKEHDVTSIDSGAFLLAVNDRLFHVAGDYQVGEAACGYDATGSGTEVALGALYAELHPVNPAEILAADEACTIATIAIKAAEAHTPWVRGPITTIDTTKKEN